MTTDKLRIKQLEEALKMRDELIESQKNMIENHQRQIDNLMEIIRQMQNDKFGSSSEKTPKKDDGGKQVCFFNEIEVEAKPHTQEPFKSDSTGRAKPNKKRNRREMIIGDIPREKIVLDISEGKRICHKCGRKLKEIGETFVREEVQYIPAHLEIKEYYVTAYECPTCKHSDNPVITRRACPPSLLSHSLASPSSVAYVIYEKYVQGVPLYRLEKEWEQMGMMLSRATMANWVIRCSQDYLGPLIAYMHRLMIARDVIHVDETPLQVLKEDDRKPQTKSYMWLYRTGNDDGEPIILFDYKPSRSGDNAVSYLEGFKGFIHTDGYSGYNKLSDITRCGCWAHLRRKFVEAIPPGKKPSDALTPAEMGRAYCDELFNIESELKELTPEKRYIKRQELEKPVLEAFWSWLDTVTALRGSKLAKAINYAYNQKPYMENYLLDGRCSISNNAAENAIRPFVTGRKNWLFVDTPRGAEASAVIYSLIETAKANNLNVYNYIELVLENMTSWDHTDEYLEDLMPWSEFTKEHCSK